MGRLALFVRLAVIAAIGLVATTGTAQSQASEPPSTRGVVWTPPRSPTAAQQVLRRMAATGATAVRLTRPVTASSVLALADTLGLALYVDLPVAYLSASALNDTLSFARRQLDSVLAQARRHTSIRAVGLARGADTTMPSACAYFDALTQHVRTRSDLPTYYVTPFRPSADACTDAVDLVLADLVGTSDPQARWNQWRQVHEAVGIGAVGRGTRAGAGRGLRVPASPERQARYLERHLPPLLEGDRQPPLFVYRWKDRPVVSTVRRYGLHRADAASRPAARVVEGIFTGRQRTFAFPQGTAPAAGAPWLVMIGWVLVAGLGVLYAQYGQVRRTLSRYFVSHGFYRDGIQGGRDLAPEASIVLLVTALCALGMGAMVAVRAFGTDPAVHHVLAVLPDGPRQVVARWIEAPVTYGVEVGVGAGVLLGAWGTGLSLAARPWSGLSAPQVLMLLAWPHWPALLGLVVALALAAQNPATNGLRIAGGWVGGGLLLSAWIMVRVLRDYVAVADVPRSVAGALALVSPPAVVVLATASLVTYYDVPVRFLYRLLVLT